MSKILLLADLHGNLPATLAMEKEINNIEPDEIYFLGDAVGKGPDSDKTCDWVREHCDYHIGGNWDYWMQDKENVDNLFYIKQLGEERLLWLRQLPKEMEMTVSGIRFRLFHGRPLETLIQGWDSDEFMHPFFETENGTYGGFICADSHRPYVRLTHRGYAMNTGSVGNSLGLPRAHALLVEGEKDALEESSIRFTTISVPYNNEEAVSIAENAKGLPNAEAYIREVRTGIYSRL